MNKALISSVGAMSAASLYYLNDQKRRTQQAQALERPQANSFRASYANIPHYKKKDRGGEDAWICNDQLIAVADGVGGWNKKGVDPGIFARELCNHVTNKFNSLRTAGHKGRYEIDLWKLLVNSVQDTKARGTSTFVMAVLDEEDAHLRALNLGDSGYTIYRPPQVAQEKADFEKLFHSEEKQYKFNHPYQCGTNYKMPWHSDVHLHRVQDGDVLILATDGVYDNLRDPHVETCLQ